MNSFGSSASGSSGGSSQAIVGSGFGGAGGAAEQGVWAAVIPIYVTGVVSF